MTNNDADGDFDRIEKEDPNVLTPDKLADMYDKLNEDKKLVDEYDEEHQKFKRDIHRFTKCWVNTPDEKDAEIAVMRANLEKVEKNTKTLAALLSKGCKVSIVKEIPEGGNPYLSRLFGPDFPDPYMQEHKAQRKKYIERVFDIYTRPHNFGPFKISLDPLVAGALIALLWDGRVWTPEDFDRRMASAKKNLGAKYDNGYYSMHLVDKGLALLYRGEVDTAVDMFTEAKKITPYTGKYYGYSPETIGLLIDHAPTIGMTFKKVYPQIMNAKNLMREIESKRAERQKIREAPTDGYVSIESLFN